MTLRSTILSILTLLLVSCTVKEERSGCPCRLSVDLSDASAIHGNAVISIWGNSQMFCSEQFPITGHQALFSKDVTKCALEVSAIQGLEKNRLAGRNVIISEGDDVDRVMAFGSEVIADQEKMTVKALFYKNWSTLTVEYENPGGHDYPFYFTVLGKINGFDAFSLVPIKGRFRHIATKQAPDKNEFIVNLPRQFNGESGLTLSVISAKDHKTEKEYDLSEMIAETGYDWTCKNLNDIRIHINYAGMVAGIEITEWENGSDFSVTI